MILSTASIIPCREPEGKAILARIESGPETVHWTGRSRQRVHILGRVMQLGRGTDFGDRGGRCYTLQAVLEHELSDGLHHLLFVGNRG